MIIICKDCNEDFECRTQALRCHICRPIAAKKRQTNYQKKYKETNNDILKARQASYHKDPALDSGYFN